MEKAHPSQPKTANNRLRQIITILLLSGGVFVLGFIWTIRYYHVFIDRVTPYVPSSADLVMTIPLTEGISPLWNAFDGRFGQALGSIRYEEGATLVLFVDNSVDNKFGWNLLTDAFIDDESLPDDVFLSHFRHLTLISAHSPQFDLKKKTPAPLQIMRRGSGKGYINENLLAQSHNTQNTIQLPLRLKVMNHSLKLELGLRFRGSRGVRTFPVDARQITNLPGNLMVYSLIPAGDLPHIPKNTELESFLIDIIKAADVISETVVTSDSSFATLLHAKKNAAQRIETIEQPILELLRTLTPTEHINKLPDGTSMTELRLNEGKVTYEDQNLPNDIFLRTYSSEDERKISLIMYPDGRIWITNKLNLVSGLITTDSEFTEEQLECQPSTSSPGSLFTINHIKDIPSLSENFKRMFSLFRFNSLRIDDKETKLFTFCGYF